MTRTNKGRIGILLAVLLLAVASLTFTSCSAKEYTVTFMVQNGTSGAWEQFGSPAAVTDGKVTVPEAPAKEGYVFRAWYTTQTFDEGTQFRNENISENLTVYACYATETVSLHVNSDDAVEAEMKDFDKLTEQYRADAAARNLTFDGWYTNQSCTEAYRDGVDATDLYARFMAQVTYDNGYEVVYTELVTPGAAMSAPATDKVLKRYMDSEDISFTDATGTAFDFSAPVNANTTVTVLWKTPYLVYERLEGSSNYAVIGIDPASSDEWKSFPCLSILSRNVTMKVKDGSTASGNVVSIQSSDWASATSTSLNQLANPEKILIAEGIVTVSNLHGAVGSKVKSIVLPSTLKILENSVWNFPYLENLTLPEGLEVIIDCFWLDYLDYTAGTVRGNGYGFDITVPAGVKTLSTVPANLKFAEGSSYFTEGNRVYKKDGENGKILVSALQCDVDANGTFTVEEGVTGMAVGVLDTLTYKYLYLPSTLTKVEYTVDRADYAGVYSGSLLTQPEFVNAPASSKMDVRAYALVGNLNSVDYVVFNTTAYPFENRQLFNDRHVSFERLDTLHLVYTGKVSEGDIQITVRYSNTMSDAAVKTEVLTVPTGSAVERDALLSQLGITSEAMGINIKVSGIKQFGADYVFGAKDCNQYIDITYEYDAVGVTTAENEDGTLTVTGFDVTRAQELANGTYLVVVPSLIDGKQVTAIGEGAFRGENRLSRIYISDSVKSIGAEAFKDTYNLEYISVTPGGLEFIGRSAFENVGAREENGVMVMNPDLPKFAFTNFTMPCVYIQIPLANLRTVEPYAFKSVGICTFMRAPGEEDRTFMTFNWSEDPMYPDMQAGDFYFMVNAGGDTQSIVQYVGTVQESHPSNSTEGNIDVNIHDVRFIAFAGGYTYNSYNTYLSVGWSIRPFGSMNPGFDKNVVRYEMMEGSVYYILGSEQITFGFVSKVHKNAFTDMGEVLTDGTFKNPYIRLYVRTGDFASLTMDDLKNQVSTIFEEGWWEGKPNAENGVTADAEEDSSLLVY